MPFDDINIKLRIIKMKMNLFKISLKNFASSKKKFFITGANGQVGRGLIELLSAKYSPENIIASDVNKTHSNPNVTFYELNVTKRKDYLEIVKENNITNIIHLASLLSGNCYIYIKASSEKDLSLAMDVNINGLHNSLEVAKAVNCSLFLPSTIASFGPNLPKTPVPDDVHQDPTTFYGISKVYMEKLGNYYHTKFNLDVRCLRLPNIISPYEYISGQTGIFATGIYYLNKRNFL